MIIGNGVLANAVRAYDREDTIFFASGVSNSLEKNPVEFEREISLLKTVVDQYPGKKLVYFSTCSIKDPTKTDSFYVNHKLNTEKIITEICPDYAIFRVGNAVGKGGNPNTLINFFKNALESGNKITLHKKARRILIDVEDIALLTDRYLDQINNETINLAYPYQYSLLEILSPMEKIINKNAVYEIADEGSPYNIEFCGLTEEFFRGIAPEEYLNKLYFKYL